MYLTLRRTRSVQTTEIGIEVAEDETLDRLSIIISDNGCGDARTGQPVVIRFIHTRTTRKVGLGYRF